MNNFVIIIPAYNEENLIKSCIESLLAASLRCLLTFNLKKILVCLNGCTDKTEQIVQYIASSNSCIEVLSVERGYINALNALLNRVREKYSDCPVIKIDADSEVEKDALFILLQELKKHPDVMIAGGLPLPRQRTKISRSKKLLAKIFSIRALFPMSEISVEDVERFHPYANQDPQQQVPAAWEKRSKIYFHGRFWVLRNSQMANLPKSHIGDDVFLTAYFLTRFGEGAIRTKYDAICYYEPYYNLKHHWKVYKRIETDKQILNRNPQLKWYIKASRTKLDWGHIGSLKFSVVIIFIFYSLIVHLERFSFHFFRYRDAYWQYQSKKPKNEYRHS